MGEGSELELNLEAAQRVFAPSGAVGLDRVSIRRSAAATGALKGYAPHGGD